MTNNGSAARSTSRSSMPLGSSVDGQPSVQQYGGHVVGLGGDRAAGCPARPWPRSGSAPAITSVPATDGADREPAGLHHRRRGPTAYPAPRSGAGALPAGVTFTDNGDGTATLAGTPGCRNGRESTLSPSRPPTTSGSPATQSFTLTVDQRTGHHQCRLGDRSPSARPLDFTVTTSAATRRRPYRVRDAARRGHLHRQRQRHRHPGRHAGRRHQRELPAHHHRLQRGRARTAPSPSPWWWAINRPAFTSASTATFTLGAAGTFTVTTSGNPAPTITKKGKVPAGLTLVANGNGTDTLSGTPTKAGTSSLKLTAKNVAGTATQTLSIAVGTGPTISAKASESVAAGHSVKDTIKATGSPNPAITESGALPTGVTFTPNTGSSTEAKLSGKPQAGTEGTYVLNFTATNTLGHASTTLTLTVKS